MRVTPSMDTAASDRMSFLRRQLAGIVADQPRNPTMVRRRLEMQAELEALATADLRNEKEKNHGTERSRQ